jgi:hypothetical protein
LDSTSCQSALICRPRAPSPAETSHHTILQRLATMTTRMTTGASHGCLIILPHRPTFLSHRLVSHPSTDQPTRRPRSRPVLDR